MRSLLCRTTIVAMCMTALVAFHGESHAAILSTFGNLGPAGGVADDPILNFLVGASGANDSRIAIKFTTASPNLLLQNAQLYFGAPTGSAVASVAVVADASGSPSSSVVATFSGVTSITTEQKYTYTTNTLLTAGTPYWLIVSQTTSGAAFSWFANADSADPTAQNASGWAYGGTKRSLNGGSTWTNFSAGSTASISLAAVAVPEPATYAMALAGLACGGYTMWRRRKRA